MDIVAVSSSMAWVSASISSSFSSASAAAAVESAAPEPAGALGFWGSSPPLLLSLASPQMSAPSKSSLELMVALCLMLGLWEIAPLIEEQDTGTRAPRHNWMTHDSAHLCGLARVVHSSGAKCAL